MKSIIFDGYLKQSVPVMVRHTEQMHRRKVHSHHQLYLLSLLGMQKITMHRGIPHKLTLTQVKVIPLLIVIQVWIEPQESRQPQQEYQMEISIACLLTVKPHDTILQIIVKQLITLFRANGIDANGMSIRTSASFCSCSLGRMSVSISNNVSGWKNCFFILLFDVLGILTINDCLPNALVNISTISLDSPYLSECSTIA